MSIEVFRWPLSLENVPSAEPPSVPGIVLRTFRQEEPGRSADIDAWLAARQQAFADQARSVRTWTAADFEAQIVSQHWWNPQHAWLAVTRGSSGDTCEGGAQDRVAGSVVLAVRDVGGRRQAMVSWLFVTPPWRRRGIATLLMQRLLSQAAEAGCDEVVAETHRAWSAASALYGRLQRTTGEAMGRDVASGEATGRDADASSG